MAVVPLSELEGTHRLDAEHYQPHYLLQEQKIEGLTPIPLSRLASVSDGNHMTIEDQFTDSGVRYLRGQDLGDFFISDTNAVYIPEEVYEDLKRSHMKSGDVLLSIVGTIGSVGLVTDKYSMLTGSCKLAIIRPKNVNPYFLAAYLSSSVGQAQIARRVRGAVQQGLILPDLRELPIPFASGQLIERIKQLIIQSQQKRSKSENLYAQAQARLTAELGLDNLDLAETQSAVRRKSEVEKAERIDAEYYRPKFQRLLKHLKSTEQSVRLGDWVVEPIKRGVQPDYSDDGDVAVINSQHVGKTHIMLEGNRYANREFYGENSNQRALVRRFDVLLNSTGYITIGRSQALLDDVLAAVDGHVSIIRPKPDLDPVYLALYLNSLPGQLQTERGWTGSSGQIELRIDVISEFVIWKAPASFQQQIRILVEQSHKARQDAHRLLAEAKAEVEHLIEEK